MGNTVTQTFNIVNNYIILNHSPNSQVSTGSSQSATSTVVVFSALGVFLFICIIFFSYCIFRNCRKEQKQLKFLGV